MSELTDDPAVLARARAMLTAERPPTLQMDRTMAGRPILTIIAAPAGRGVERERFAIVAVDLSSLFAFLARAVS